MLAIRMQRTGRKGHAAFRMVVQDSRQTPTSRRVVAQLGHYDPHTKAIVLNKEQASFYLEHGAQPSDRVARLLKKEGVTLPKWVAFEVDTERKTRNPEKLRKNQPKDTTPKEEVVAEEAPATEAVEAEAKPEVVEETATAPEAEVTETPADKTDEKS